MTRMMRVSKRFLNGSFFGLMILCIIGMLWYGEELRKKCHNAIVEQSGGSEKYVKLLAFADKYEYFQYSNIPALPYGQKK